MRRAADPKTVAGEASNIEAGRAARQTEHPSEGRSGDRALTVTNEQGILRAPSTPQR